jgi:RNA polymerase sigma factor (sigma-70 family)
MLGLPRSESCPGPTRGNPQSCPQGLSQSHPKQPIPVGVANRRPRLVKYGVMELSDAEVIEASWRNPEAFGTIFDRHLQAIFGYCARRMGAGPAEDLAGETFLRAFHGRGRFDLSQASARPWLFGIARNVVREQSRDLGRQGVSVESSHAHAGFGPVDPAVLASAGADARHDLDVIARALPELPEDEVETLLLHVWEGLSYAECALTLGIPIGTVRSRLNRIRRRLRERLPQDPLGTPVAQEPSTVPLRLLGGTDERPA